MESDSATSQLSSLFVRPEFQIQSNYSFPPLSLPLSDDCLSPNGIARPNTRVGKAKVIVKRYQKETGMPLRILRYFFLFRLSRHKNCNSCLNETKLSIHSLNVLLLAIIIFIHRKYNKNKIKIEKHLLYL